LAMLFAPIVPIPMLNSIQNDRYHMILPHLLKNKDYASFYSQVEGFKILDNGAAEREDTNLETLLVWAKRLAVDEVVMPDEYDNTWMTCQLLDRYKVFFSDIPFMVVLHAKDWSEFEYVLAHAIRHGASSVGLPRVMCIHLGADARVTGARIVRQFTDMPIHALGSTLHLDEAKELAHLGLVRGIDTSAPVVQGLADRGIDEAYALRGTDFFRQQPNRQAEVNLDKFRSWCSEAPSSQV